MKISKRTREAAANICNARASWWETDVVREYLATPEARRLFGDDAERLAQDAICCAWADTGFDSLAGERWLTAEAMIREGWTP